MAFLIVSMLVWPMLVNIVQVSRRPHTTNATASFVSPAAHDHLFLRRRRGRLHAAHHPGSSISGSSTSSKSRIPPCLAPPRLSLAPQTSRSHRVFDRSLQVIVQDNFLMDDVRTDDSAPLAKDGAASSVNYVSIDNGDKADAAEAADGAPAAPADGADS